MDFCFGEGLLAFLLKMGEMHKISFCIDLEKQTGPVSQEGQVRDGKSLGPFCNNEILKLLHILK